MRIFDMVSLVNEGELSLLVAYSVDRGEAVHEAIVNAFLAANIDVSEKGTTLEAWIDTDSISGFDWHPETPLFITALIWGHLVVISSERVRVYSDSSIV